MGSIETVAEEEILSKIKSLGNREIREVMDFIDFIQEKRGGKAEQFRRYIIEKADRKITLAQVLQELSSIKGNLSEIISRQREERG
jgi:hypothetical protein